MTVLHTGSTKKFATGWDNIFSGGKGSRLTAAKTPAATTKKSTAKKGIAKKPKATASAGKKRRAK